MTTCVRRGIAGGAALTALIFGSGHALAASAGPTGADSSTSSATTTAIAPQTNDPLRRAATLASPSAVLVDYTATGYLNDNSTGHTYGEIDSSGNMDGKPIQVEWIGTGFFVSNDGYIVTAAHVAAPSDDSVRQSLVEEFINEGTGCQQSGDCTAAYAKFEPQLMLETQLSNVQRSIQVVTQDQNDPSKKLVGRTAELKASSATSAHDIAVIKVSIDNSPSLTFADSSSVGVQDPVAVIGYPADSLKMSNRQTILVPSVSRGSITALKQGGVEGLATDANVLQTDAGIEHGNSGGPAVDEHGSVVGMVSYGGSGSVNYLIASNDIRDVVRQAAVDTTPGQVTGLWQQGYDAFSGRHFRQAKQLLEQCVALSPIQVGCSSYAQKATANLSQDVPIEGGSAGTTTSSGSASQSSTGTATGTTTLTGTQNASSRSEGGVNPTLLVLVAAGVIGLVGAGLTTRRTLSGRNVGAQTPAPGGSRLLPAAPSAPAEPHYAFGAAEPPTVWGVTPAGTGPVEAVRSCWGCGAATTEQAFCGTCGQRQPRGPRS